MGRRRSVGILKMLLYTYIQAGMLPASILTPYLSSAGTSHPPNVAHSARDRCAPNVFRLQLHLEGEQTVAWDEDMTSQQLRDKAANTETTLTAFFRYNASHPEEEPCLYQNFRISHTHVQSTRQWKLRQRGMTIGRMYHCPPQSGQRWYLRRLLTKTPGLSRLRS